MNCPNCDKDEWVDLEGLHALLKITKDEKSALTFHGNSGYIVKGQACKGCGKLEFFSAIFKKLL